MLLTQCLATASLLTTQSNYSADLIWGEFLEQQVDDGWGVLVNESLAFSSNGGG